MVKPCIKQSKRMDHHKWFSKALSFVAKIARLGVLSMSLHFEPLYVRRESYRQNMAKWQLNNFSNLLEESRILQFHCFSRKRPLRILFCFPTDSKFPKIKRNFIFVRLGVGGKLIDTKIYVASLIPYAKRDKRGKKLCWIAVWRLYPWDFHTSRKD